MASRALAMEGTAKIALEWFKEGNSPSCFTMVQLLIGLEQSQVIEDQSAESGARKIMATFLECPFHCGAIQHMLHKYYRPEYDRIAKKLGFGN